jgi:hypothetical protein
VKGIMAFYSQVIHIQVDAPRKPPEGAACNGCGVCCLAEPCPLGMVLSRKRHGACVALRWNESQKQYRCGALAATFLGLPVGRFARRWISAGSGCDSNLEPAPQISFDASDNGHHD